VLKKYVYKIQWLFNDIKSLKKAINILGVKSLDKIIVRNYDFKIIDEYNSFIQYPYGLAENETIKYMKNLIKKNNNIKYFEVLRK